MLCLVCACPLNSFQDFALLGTGVVCTRGKPSLLIHFISEVAVPKTRQGPTALSSAVAGTEGFLHAASHVRQLSDLVKEHSSGLGCYWTNQEGRALRPWGAWACGLWRLPATSYGTVRMQGGEQHMPYGA